ncbi:type VI secretion system contractile sheath small subunit [Trabulsiella odontotermitis]|uniref:type VI secretion system contractile sheath small subunit n=1 Tax=Trabulsiella odontotermitis TaxID=379893 RepID=UPI0006767EBE|nr:type VI secretion system contractile sheath small subunit [Trabulsiella odontotermitis]KNC89665.1 type VI secretion protein [Trabulsiella odontotermitis]
MSKDSSVAPKERINIKYVPNTGDQIAEIELPLNLFVVGDMKGVREDSSLEERQPVSINKNNFNSVMSEAGLSLSFVVPNRLDEKESNEGENDLPVRLDIHSLSDFSPDNVARNVPELNKLLELREALVALKGPLGNIPAFRSKLQALLKDEKAREQLLEELNILDKK